MAEAWTPLLTRDPSQIGPYQLAGRLGAGGMGVVYLGWSRERPVAVKVMRDELASDAHFRARFAREVEVLRKIGGTCTVAVLDADADADPPYLVTEYVPGPSLSAYVAEHGPMDTAQVTALGAGLAEALHAIHSAGIVHRDLKPSNVLLTPNGPRVIDFGIAQVADATALTQSATSLGSPGYLAPEQVRGLSNTAAADVFTWGATVAYAATGRPPFGLGAADAVLFRVLHDDADLANWSAPQLRPLVEAALSKTPGDRPTPRELIQALLPDDSTARLPPADATAQLLAHTWYLPSDVTVTLPQPVVPVAAPARRGHRAAWYAAAAAAGALLGGASLLAFPPASPAPTHNAAAAGPASPAAVPSPRPSLASAAGSPSPVAAKAPLVWSSLKDTYRAVPAGAAVPDFPASVPGYVRADSSRATVRAFSGSSYATLYNFPDTMNGCDQQRFYLRWRALNPKALIDVVSGNSPQLLAETAPRTGNAGWQSTSGCEEPGFRLHSSSDGSTLSDVVVEVQRWVPSVS